jgi:parallel beta-helix repeat protein
MFIRFRPAAVAVIGAATALMVVGAPAIGNAVPPPGSTLYVSPTGVVSNNGTSCDQATFTSIEAAVTAAEAGSTVIACAGEYVESVTVDKQLTLVGQGAHIDATNQPYGIGIAASYSTVRGFNIRAAHADESTGAPGDGIVTAGIVGSALVASDHDVIVDNVTANNDGSGIDVESSSSSIVSDNLSIRNGIGINVSNDLGAPSSFDKISGNTTNDNPGGCGIVLADHSGSGVFNIQVLGNTARGNGLGTPSAPKASAGSGLIIAAGGPHGGVYNNQIRGNTFTNNGHAGVALHGHGKGPRFSRNMIIGNTFGKNNKRTDYKDKKLTGIYLGDVAKVNVVVKSNVFRSDYYGIFSAGPVHVHNLKTNAFMHVKVHLKHVKTYAG